ncbi:hypothetical protein ACTXT7_007634 [Hymenolepis weldensis]
MPQILEQGMRLVNKRLGNHRLLHASMRQITVLSGAQYCLYGCKAVLIEPAFWVIEKCIHPTVARLGVVGPLQSPNPPVY